jgi:DNA-binding NtrC family response regulator
MPTHPELMEVPVSYTPNSPVPVRVLLFKSNLLDALHLRLAIDMSPLWCDVQVVEENMATVRSCHAAILSGTPPPEMILFDCDLRDAECLSLLDAVKSSLVLGDLPLVVVGNHEPEESAVLARRHGATAFVRRPARTGDLASVGREIARIWAVHEDRKAEALA